MTQKKKKIIKYLKHVKDEDKTPISDNAITNFSKNSITLLVLVPARLQLSIFTSCLHLFCNCTFLLSNEETKVCTLTKLYKLGSKKEPMYVKQIGFN